jgi:glycosyltransferase involved in cell wall biosynthesis
MDSPNVVLASNSAWSLLKFRLGLIRTLQDQGLRVIALAPRDGSEERLPCECFPIRVNRSGTNPLEDLALLRELRRQYRGLRPVAALHFTSKLNIYGALAARWLRIPSIGNITGLGSAFLGGGPVAWIQQRLYRFALSGVQRIFFQNPEDLRLFTGRRLADPSRSRLIPGSGVDLQAFSPRPLPPNERFVFLLIARLLRDKGIHEYVEAARRLKAGGADVECRLVGHLDSGNPSAVDEGSLARWTAEGVIEYRGARDDVREEIALADCVVLPSYREGTPHTLLEAAAMARPLIASDVPGCRQVVEDGVNGFLCRARDSADLAARMSRMLDTPEAERRAMGSRGRAKMQKEFDEGLVVRAYLEALRELRLLPS